MNKNKEVEKLKQALMKKIKLENNSRYINLNPDEVMKNIIDSSLNGKYVLWVCREYLKNNIQRFEDIESRCKQALTLFRNNLNKFDNSQKQLGKLSFQELETIVSPYQDILTQNATKRMSKEKIWSEIDVIYEGPEGRIYVPKTEQASMFLGQGTKWCTASTNNNMFDYYNQQGSLYIFVLNKKDEEGREIKYQLHIQSEQFMNSEDIKCDLIEFKDNFCFFNKVFGDFSVKQKIKIMINSNLFFKFFIHEEELFEHMENVLVEKIKIKNFDDIFEYISEELKTSKICELAVQQNGNNLCCVPKKIITKELCEIAVTNSDDSLEFVPDELKTKELCELAVGKYGFTLYDVPDELKTKELCEIATRNDGQSLKFVPDMLKTKELCEIAVNKDVRSIIYFPFDFLTKELYENLVSQNWHALVYVPKEMITYELCKTAISLNGKALQFVPNKYKTQELCEMAVKNTIYETKKAIFGKFGGGEPNILSWVPESLITKDLCELSVNLDGTSLAFVPDKFKTYELCKIAVKQDGIALCHVPNEIKTKELYEIAVKQNSWTLTYVAHEFRTKELCKLAVSLDGETLRCVPYEFRTKELCELALSKTGKSLPDIPHEFITKEMCIKTILDGHYLGIPNAFRTQEFYKEIIEIILSETNIFCTFEEAIKMIYDLTDNPVKNYLRDTKYLFLNVYVDMIAEEISQKINVSKLKI